MLHDFILEPPTEYWVFFLVTSVVDGWDTVLTQPILNLVALIGKEVEDTLYSVLLGEHFVMLFLFSQLVWVNEAPIFFRLNLEAPELLFKLDLALKAFLVGFHQVFQVKLV